MKIGIVGLGLIGGSMARSIKMHTKHTVLGIDLKESEMKKAELIGAIDGRLTDEQIPNCDVVIVALFPAQIVRYITEKQHLFAAGTRVFDCGGVKQVVCTPIDALAKNAKWKFIGGHPMAGREFSGFSYSKDDLFESASMILTPASECSIEERVWAKNFFLEIGFLRVRFTTPEAHDEIIGYTSQMAHVVSSAYVKTEMALKHKGFSAGSFQDMTRVALLNEHMWTELFMDNREPLLHEVQGMIDRLCEYRDALASGDAVALKNLLREGREMKEMLDE